MLRRISDGELRDLAAAWSFELDDGDVEQLGAVARDLLEVLDPIAAGSAPAAPVLPASREAGERPAPADDPLNAILRRCRVRALEPQPGGALEGMRFAIKDSMAIAGIPLTLGSLALEGFVPDVDAVAVERLLGAGAELVAVTNMDDFAFSGGGDSSAYGATLNPYDRTRTAGGSSGGSAAALHYDGIDAALGTDQGGSIRVPAAWCGVVGLKPTHSLVPYTGIAGIDATFDHVGPIARTVPDAARVLGVLAGRDPSDPRQPGPVAVEDYEAAVDGAPADLEGVRIGIVAEGLRDDGDEAAGEPAAAAAIRDLAARARAAGAELTELAIPEHLTSAGVAFAGFIEGMTALMTGGGNGYHWRGRYWPELAEALGETLRERAGRLSPQVKTTLMVGLHLRREHCGAIYARAQNMRGDLVAAHDRALSGVDCLLMGATPGLPHVHDPDLPAHDRLMRGWAVLANTAPTDMTGHPALTVPVAEADGLPVGAMLVGRRFDDARLLRIGRSLELALGRRPGASASAAPDR